MKKIATLTFVFLGVLLAAVPSVNAQLLWSPWDPVGRWQSSQMHWLDSMVGRAARGYGQSVSTTSLAGTWKQVPCATKKAQFGRLVLAAAVGAGVGYASTGTTAGAYRGAAAGGAVGAGTVVVDQYRRCWEFIPAPASAQQPGQSMPQAVYPQAQATPDQAAVYQTAPSSPTHIVYRQGGGREIGGQVMEEEWVLVNGTENPARPILLYDRGRAFKWLTPGETITVRVPMGEARFKAIGYRQAKLRTFEVRDVPIPLEVEKAEGDTKLTFAWPQEISEQ